MSKDIYRESGRDNHGPGVVRTISGELVNVTAPDPDTLLMPDIAWALGRILRYNGHIKQDYTVAHHSVIMSYYVSPERRLEALLHDAAEAYIGDIVYPVKEMLSEISLIEGRLAHAIFTKYGLQHNKKCSWHVPHSRDRDDLIYIKSEEVAEADRVLYQHECFSFGDRPGVYSQKMQDAWNMAVQEHSDLWGAGYYPFIHRYFELIGADVTRQRINELVEPLWYGQQESLDNLPPEVLDQINEAASELL